MKFEENWPRGFREEACQMCVWMDRWMTEMGSDHNSSS